MHHQIHPKCKTIRKGNEMRKKKFEFNYASSDQYQLDSLIFSKESHSITYYCNKSTLS